MFAGIQDPTNEGRQIASLHDLNMFLSMGNGHVKIGEITPVLVKLFNSSSNPEVVRGTSTLDSLFFLFIILIIHDLWVSGPSYVPCAQHHH